MTAPASEDAQRYSRGLLLTLALVAAFASLAVHMLVPGLPLISREMQVEPGQSQLVISIYLVGLAAGQLIGGPLSDMFGRRRLVLCALALFVAGSLAAAIAPSAGWLFAARGVQAFGGAIGLVSARAIISDISSDADVTGRFATLTSVALLSPLLAPTLGGGIVELAGWRAIFVLLGIASAATGVVILLRFVETLPCSARVASFRRIAPGFGRLIGNPQFRRFSMANAAGNAGLYAFLGGSSFLLIDRWHLTPGEAGLFYCAVTLMGLIGSLQVRRLPDSRAALRIGFRLMLLGSILMVGLALGGADRPLALLIPMLVICAGSGMASPACIASAMRAEPGLAATAASLAGAIQMTLSALTSSALLFLAAGSFPALAITVLLLSLIAWLVGPSRESTKGASGALAVRDRTSVDR